MKKRCCIIGAAPINNYQLVKTYLDPTVFFIYCDGGLYHREPLGYEPDLIIGDFDSHKKEDFKEETIVLPTVKDDTDCFFAAKEAIRRGFRDFIIIGCLGLRLDHTLGNIAMLLFLYKKGCKALMVDDYSEMEIVGKDPCFVDPKFSYFSLLNIEGPAKGIFIENAKYELKDACLFPDFPLGGKQRAFKRKGCKNLRKRGKPPFNPHF